MLCDYTLFNSNIRKWAPTHTVKHLEHDRTSTAWKHKKMLILSNELLLICNSTNFARWNRSSRPDVFCKKVALRNFAKFTGKHLCQSLFFDKVAGLRTVTSLKKRLWHRCFPVNGCSFQHLLLQNLIWFCLNKEKRFFFGFILKPTEKTYKNYFKKTRALFFSWKY